MTYKGYTQTTDEKLANYYEGKDLNELLTNQYVIHNGQAVRFDGHTLVDLKLPNIKGFKAKNIQQRMALDLLHNESIPAKVLTGVAGSGKTRLAVQYGLYLLDKGKVEKIFITRNPATIGEEIGFLPGDKREKINFITQPILDNLEDGEFGLEKMFQYNKLEFEVPNYMQGRDLRNAFIIVDEAQLLNPELVKMLGSRVGENSQIVFVGDYEQAFHKNYKGDKNGLVRAIEVLKGHHLFGVVELSETVRSEVAKLFAGMQI